MKSIIYCECGWAGTPQQLEISETVNNVPVKVCPVCGTDMLPPAVHVNEETFEAIMKQQRQELEEKQEEEED